jgi:hypothetical protein
MRFIKGYASICRTLHDALQKNAFTWFDEQQNAFQKLKNVMSTPSVPALSNFALAFTLEIDASGTGLGAVLMQQGRPLAYFSKALGPKSATLSIYEKKALAIQESLRKWRHYLLGNQLIIKTGQRSLKYLSSQRLLEGIQHKIMLKLLEFDYSIEYKKGTDNTAADALSRKYTDPMEEQCTTISATIPTWMTEVVDTYVNETKCTQLLQELAISATSNPKYTLTSGILRYKNRIVLGTATDLRDIIFNAFHSSIFGGYSGNRVTHHMIKRLSFWPHLKQFTADKVAQCPVCQISKIERVHYSTKYS